MSKKTKSKTTLLVKGGASVLDRSIVMKVEFRSMGNRRKLIAGQYQVDAEKKMVSASKRLLDSPELKKIDRLDGDIWRYVAARALPSGLSGGFWVLPISLIEEVDGEMTNFANKRKALVEEFLKEYPKLIEAASQLLRTTFNENDYPTEDEVRAKFGLYWRYVSFGVPEQLEAIKGEVFAREQAKAAEHWATATDEMKKVMRATATEMVDHLVDRLTPGEDGKPKVFRASMMDQVHDFITTFDARNIVDDEQLKGIVDKARKLVDGVSHETLKTDADLREKIRKGMAKVKTNLDALVIVRPTRKIRFNEEKEAA